MEKPLFGELIIGMHTLARDIDNPHISIKIRVLADQLAQIGNDYHEANKLKETKNV